MSLADFLFGRPIATSEDDQQKVGVARGVPAFGLDALSSAAYGPEAALTVLIPLGAAGVTYVTPLTGAIVLLLALVYFSYRQTIGAYPHGGGSYTVAKENLGVHAGLLAGSALMIDYVLNVAVGISAGVGAMVSALPNLQPWTLTICLLILTGLTIVNLRGIREAGAIFMVPTYLFISCMFRRDWLGTFPPCACRCGAASGRKGDSGGNDMVAVESLRERMYCDDRRGSGEQRRPGVRRAHSSNR